MANLVETGQGTTHAKPNADIVKDEISDVWGRNPGNSRKPLPCPALRRGCIPAGPAQTSLQAASPGPACSRGPDPRWGRGEARARPLSRAASAPECWQRLCTASGSGQHLLFSPCPDPDGAAALPAPSENTKNVLHTNSL